VELSRVDVNPALIGRHFEPGQVFFHQTTISVI
jgi:hypothetical protein